MKMKTNLEYLAELKSSLTDEIAPGIGGELVRLAQMASGGVTSQSERENVAIALLTSARRIGVDSKNLRAVAAGLITRYDKTL